MVRMNIYRHGSVAAILAVLVSPATASPKAEANPAQYLQAFNDTCRKGFPDLDAIAASALAQGWQGSAIRAVGGGALPPGLPRAFHKDGLMLFLVASSSDRAGASYQISGSDPTKLTGADMASLVSPSLNVAPPVFQKDKGSDVAVWTIAPGTTVQAGISIYGKMRTISISERR